MAETILRYNMLSGARRVGVAVSGGADSIFLLTVLREWAEEHGVELAVLHLNHALRGAESDSDEAFVREAALHAGLPFVAERASGLNGLPNLEANARQARYEFFARAAAAHRLERVATGHTLDDQAETFLLRLLRGAAGTGLAGIAPVTGAGIVRPLLEIERPEIEAWLLAQKIGWREDASNLDPVFARNRVRHDLLPMFEREWNPAIRRVLARTASVLAGEDDFWQRWVEAELARHGSSGSACGGGGIILELPLLRPLHPAQLRRLLRGAVEIVKGDLRQVDQPHIYRLAQLCLSTSGSGSVRLPGLAAVRSFDRVLLTSRFTRSGIPPFKVTVSQPGRIEFPGAGTLSIRVANTPIRNGYNTIARGDTNLIDPPVVVRGWRPGDAYQPTGYARSWKLKDLFQECKVPSWERQFWPIIEADGQIVWARRFGLAAGAKVNWSCDDELPVRR